MARNWKSQTENRKLKPERSMKLKFCLSAALLLAAAAQAGENGMSIKADALRAAPFVDAKSIATLATGSAVEILKRDGGWYQVKSPQGSGWIRMLSIRRGSATKGSPGNELSGLSGLASGRAGTGRVVSTTGIRGLNEEELKAARYDEKQLLLAESFLTGKAQAQKFATQAKLRAKTLDYLPESSGASK
jgi:hypothetical protein